MKQEKSCGCIVIKDNNVLLVQNTNCNWSFPKGHMESGETEKETALRETKEETNLDVEIISEKRYVISYQSKPGVVKEVVYFVAKPLSNDCIIQEKEIICLGYFDLDEALNVLSYEDIKKLFRRFYDDYISNRI